MLKLLKILKEEDHSKEIQLVGFLFYLINFFLAGVVNIKASSNWRKGD